MQRELKIRETALGPDHQWLAASLNNLAELYREQGKYAEAEPLYRRALKIDEKTHGTDHPEHAVYLNNLALLYHMESKYDQAEPLYQQALKIEESARGPDHPMVAIRLDNLAALYNGQGKFAEAEPLYQRALEIDEKALGPAHPHFAICLNNLAALYATQGKYVQAEPLYQRALKNDLNALGPDHPDVARELFNLASIQGAEGQWPQAAKYVDQGRHIIRRHAAHELPTLSAKDQLTFLQVTDAGPFHGALSLGLIQRADSMIAAKSAAWLLNGKAVAQEALTQSALLARESSSPSAATAIKQLLESRRQLATLAMSTPQAGQEAQRRQHLEKLQTQEADLARQVSQATGGRISAEPWVDVETVRKALPADGILIDLARFDIFNFQATGTEKKFLSAHYVGWIVPPAGRGVVQIVDLGLAGSIDRAVDAVRDAMQCAMGDGQRKGAIQERGEGEAEKLMQQPLAELAELVWAPIAKQIAEDTKEIILSPDASLWLVPWGALPIEDGKYAIEKYNIRGTRFQANSSCRMGGCLFLGGQADGTTALNSGEIYDPVANKWTYIAPFPESILVNGPTMLLADGRVLAGSITGPNTYIYDSHTDSWSPGPTKLYGDSNNHESWTLLPDGSILCYDVNSNPQHAQRLDPATMTWIDSGAVPVSLEAGIGAGLNMDPEFYCPTVACCSWGDLVTRRSTLHRRYLAARERGRPDQSSQVVWKLVVPTRRTLAISPDPRWQRFCQMAVCCLVPRNRPSVVR